jgi:hypothetical protein
LVGDDAGERMNDDGDAEGTATWREDAGAFEGFDGEMEGNSVSVPV